MSDEPNGTWTMPKWMERFRSLINNTGGNPVEELVNDRSTTAKNNVIRAALCVAVSSQVQLLHTLERGGHLRLAEDTHEPEPGTGRVDTFRSLDGRRTTTGLFFPGVAEVHEVSDGYHTMGELYDHRRALTVALARALEMHPRLTVGSWRSKAHHPDDDPMFPGYFIVGLELTSPNPMTRNTVTYHYKLRHWDEFEGVPVLAHALKWDGAPPEESITRLMSADL